MPAELTEAEWRIFSDLRELALERFCGRAISDITRAAAAAARTNRQRHRRTVKVMNARDKELADAFDNPSRADALRQLALMQSHNLLTEDEMSQFSSETREGVRLLIRMWEPRSNLKLTPRRKPRSPR
jgi:hypothetical protein